jgi:cell division protein FtsQ
MKKTIKDKPKVDFVFKRRLQIFMANFKWWFKWFCLIGLILFGWYNKGRIWYYGLDTALELSVEAGFKLNNIVIEGQKNLSIQDLLAQFNADNNTPIFLINLDEARKILLQNDWVAQAIVMRILPSTIVIKILERKPIAVWQYNKELFLIDDSGHSIKADVAKFTNLPHFVGSGANLYAASFLKTLEPNLLEQVRSIVRVGERRWDLLLKNGALIKLPEKDIQQALRYLQEKYLSNAAAVQKIKMLDMRDSQKYYITKY